MSEKFLNEARTGELWQAVKDYTIPTKSLTKSEYNDLTEQEKMADVQYIITDDNSDSFGFGGGVPSGCILIWSGASNAVPDGWALCDGTNGTPDLRGRFVLGTSSKYAVGATGGEEYHKLTISEMPSHTHAISSWSVEPDTGLSSGQLISTAKYTKKTPLNYESNYSGGGSSHNNMPPYYVLCYIMKL